MPGLNGRTIDFLTEVVLDDAADRQDRLFSLNLLIAEGSGSRRALERISQECHDAFIRKIALLQTAWHRAERELGALSVLAR